jgi:hypothetical protein
MTRSSAPKGAQAGPRAQNMEKGRWRNRELRRTRHDATPVASQSTPLSSGVQAKIALPLVSPSPAR